MYETGNVAELKKIEKFLSDPCLVQLIRILMSRNYTGKTLVYLHVKQVIL